MFVSSRLSALLLAVALVASACTQPQTKPDKAEPPKKDPVAVKVISFNDLHGNLEAPSGKVTVDGERVEAGGVAFMKAYVDKLKGEHPNTIVVSAGDLVGASPLVSSVFHDEPTIEAMNQLPLDLIAVGNHEFDEGWEELLRLQNGGCHPETGCQTGESFEGAKFQFLAANVIKKDDGKTIFPAHQVKEYDGLPVGFIGLTLEGTDKIVSPEAVEGLEFRDEVEVINESTAALQSEGVEAIVVLIHEGARPSKELDSVSDCGDIEGPVVDIVKNSSEAVDVFVTGHSHKTYVCEIDGKLVTSAKSYGRLLTEIDLTLDPETRDVVEKKAVNHVVYNDKEPANTQMAELVETYVDKSAAVANRSVGTVTASISREANEAGESALGDVIADAQLAATKAADKGGAQVAFMNPGGIRSSLEAKDATAEKPATVTYEDLHRAQPFGNTLMTMTLTGAQIHDLLEMQWSGSHPKILQVSEGFSYTWNPDDAPGDRVDLEQIELNGQPIDAEQGYRVTVNSFLASGGDGFTILKEGTERRPGAIDLDVLADYFELNSPVEPGSQDRIKLEE
ncbi:bifunctional metallophosphatase/5'-nucleotidase [Persicimonas caeni]|uniref:Bifunctional metallophosphatase/5'-nucleotidase n=1 Tax=Persicimonas caeni TaxID=2292766 RepID=A0A4Y6PX94_PERCE|nr:bifunctional metallophosphatase/5'-nucleotidase [Persicimonas caeni]QDG52954.1 bifunctional metallophosphatase/5'-nucleotidase [Persicimonas caeni]QED34176.1 bifunctional metallophosphatase/5'-nucleotidase [Persicimonas caeni]